MPPLSLLEKNKSIALHGIIAVFNALHRKGADKSFSLLLSLLSHSLFRLRKLASLCGVSLLAFAATNELMGVHRDPQPFKSSIAADLDNDGDIDIANANSASGEVSLIKNNFLSFDKMNLPADIHTDLISAYDLDGDGDQDLIVMNKSSGEVQVLENRGTEGFTPLQPSSLGTPVDEATIANMYQNSGGEVVFSGPNVFGIAKQSGTEGFLPSSALPSDDADIQTFAVADLDNDGDNDVVFSKIGAPGIAVANNQGSENFVPQSLHSEISDLSDLVVADIDSDGDKDLVFASNYPPMVGLSRNDGSENFLPAELIMDDFHSVDQLEVADLDLDNDLDIVAASSESDAKYLLENQGSEGFLPIRLG